ncbi:m-AAA protease-interacting protein 1, mitochondrial [Pseudolycoriella hygida]|uniref:M-AAA protease-interacting protein 1, mitochondrial n=1 Tax=Pseudolycoriella hygida TaxID=35572 RepID=A0A9Q0RUU6_9DIPT|nr:m-AAA protease-interacting protein 1, mitochondrial [Pseudolycoriella hygida]KAJ6643938.1 m-AAA protease-interacting protein 1, mitochondrial [Pseudolycoriella hygida]
MALSVVQKNIHKCSSFNARSILLLGQNKFSNETTSALSALTNKSRNVYHSRSLCYLTQSNASQTKQTNFHTALQPTQCFYGLVPVSCRAYSTEHNHWSNKLPALMEFPNITWPSLIKSIKNWILVNFIIRPYFDQDFTMPNFVEGAKHAVQVVSSAVASGELNSLDGLVSPEALNEIKRNFSVMSVGQRNEIAINKEDIYFGFTYQVGVIFDESIETVQKRFVEITVVFHVLRGLQKMRDDDAAIPLNIGTLPQYRGKVSICNYRFIKQFTQGHESDWTVNVAHHFRPIDQLNE